jgi:hypothetical protein
VSVLSPEGLPDGLQSAVYATRPTRQLNAPIVLEQYVRAWPTYVDDPQKADVVFVAFYPVIYRIHHSLFGPHGPLNDTEAKHFGYSVSANLSKPLMPAIERLPPSTVLVFVMAHVDDYSIVDKFILSQIRHTHPKRIITLRSDMGDTACKCYKRPYWGDGLENILIPYCVMQPFNFISQQARSLAETVRNMTLFFYSAAGITPSQSRRRELVAGLRALNRSDVSVGILTGHSTRFDHNQYINSMLRSKFCLVPEGDVSTSLRLYEAIVAKCVPVIVSDCMDVAFDGLEPVGEYSSFAVQLPEASNGGDIVARLDALLVTGGYERMLSWLDAIWPYFTFHNGSLPQPTAAQLVMRQVLGAVQRMDDGLLPLSIREAGARRHCGY